MENIEPKENKCVARFFCNHSINEPCVYFSGKDIFCEYKGAVYDCRSQLAIANRIILLSEGFKVE